MIGLEGTKLTGRDLLGVARLRAQEDEPYFTNALFSLRVIEMPGFGTLGVDENFRLIFDPLVAEQWGVKKLTFVTRHEIRHPLLQHMERERIFTPMVEKDLREHWSALVAWMKSKGCPIRERCTPHAIHQLMNVMQDCEINQSMIHGPDDAKEAAEYDALLPGRFGFPQDELFETYIQMALQQAKRMPREQREEEGDGEGRGGKRGPDAGGGGAGADPGDGEAEGNGEEAGERGREDGADHPRDEDGPDPGAGNGRDPGNREAAGKRSPGCGGSCGIPEEIEKALTEAGHEPLTQGESDTIRNVVAAAIQQSNDKGNIPASLRKWAEERLKPPRVPWENELRAVVRDSIAESSGANSYSYKRTSRRSEGTGFILPALRSPVPKVGIVVDSSGSMGSGEGSRIEAAYSETAGIVKSMRCPVKVWSVDCAVANVMKVSGKIDIAKLAEGGGGGTDMRVGIKAAADDPEKLDIIVVLTDAITDWPTKDEMPKRAKVIAAVVGTQEVPDHIRVIRIPNTQ